jgi:hypothetical protein
MFGPFDTHFPHEVDLSCDLLDELIEQQSSHFGTHYFGFTLKILNENDYVRLEFLNNLHIDRPEQEEQLEIVRRLKSKFIL